MSEHLLPLSTGLYRAKQLALRGIDDEECLTLATMYDKVCYIASDQEQELMFDCALYALARSLKGGAF